MEVKVKHDIYSGLDTAFINSASNSNLAYRPEFVSNDYTQGKKYLLQLNESFDIVMLFLSVWHLLPKVDWHR